MPGAGKQPPQMQSQIQTLLEAGFDPTTIHLRLQVGRSSIYRMKRSLAKHGTPYMPPSLNKKNGRPKVLSADQELEIREWLRDPKNRDRYLDDLVWLCHDRFGIVCSTTTMSKLKRKWLKVLEAEESGVPLEEGVRRLVEETHPDLEVLRMVVPPGYEVPRGLVEGEEEVVRMAEGAVRRQRQLQQGQMGGGEVLVDPRIRGVGRQQQQMHGHLSHGLATDPQLHEAALDPHLQHAIDSELQQQIQDDVAVGALHECT